MFSIWETRQFHREADLVVVGAGIVGLFTALFHKRANPQHHVVVLERGPFPSGASVKNAGFACFGSPSELLADLASEGMDAMLARVEERWKGSLELRSELGPEIGFEPTGGHEIYAAHDPRYTAVAEGFDRLNRALEPIFGTQPFRWDDQRIKTFGLSGVEHLAVTDLEGPLDSGLLMSTLLRKAITEGVLFRSNSAVEKLDDNGSSVHIALSGGELFKASNVVVATNGYTRGLLPKLDVLPARGQVLITAPIEGLRLKGTFHYDEGFYYFRNHHGAVLLGGGRNLDIEGETTTEDATTPLVQDELERILTEVILPGQDNVIAHRWSGIMAVGGSKTPIIKHVSPRVIAAVRLGGMGVAIGIRVARRAARMLT